MFRDGCLDLRSESGFDDEFPTHITKVAADDEFEILYEDGMNSLTYYMQVPYTWSSGVSAKG